MFRSGFRNLTAAAVTMLVTLVSTPLLVAIIGVENYGVWSVVVAIGGIVASLEGGLSISTTVFLSRDLERNDDLGVSQTITATVSGILIAGIVAAAFIWLSAPWLISAFSNLDPKEYIVATSTLQLSALVVCFRMYQQLSDGLLQAFGRYGYTSLVTSAQSIVLSLGLLAVAWLSGSLVDMMKWYLLSAALFLAISIVLCVHVLTPYHIRFSFNWSKCTQIVRYSSTVWGVAVSSTLFGQVDKLIVGRILGASSVGIYALVTSIAMKINSISAAVVQPLLPRISREYGKAQLPQKELEGIVRQGLLLNVGIAFGLGVGLFGVALYLMNAILPPQEAALAVVALKFAALIYALYSANAVGYYVLVALSPTLCLRIQLAATFTSLGLIAVGAHYFGVLGAIIGNIGFITSWFLIGFAMSHLSIKLSTWLSWIWIPLAWFAVAVATLWYANFTSFSGYATVFVALVALYLWIAAQIGIDLPEISRRLMAQKQRFR